MVANYIIIIYGNKTFISTAQQNSIQVHWGVGKGLSIYVPDMDLGKFVVTCLVLMLLLQIRTTNSIVAVFNWLCLSADLVARIELNHSDHGETEATAIV